MGEDSSQSLGGHQLWCQGEGGKMDSLHHLPAVLQLWLYAAFLRVSWGQFIGKKLQRRIKSTLEYFLLRWRWWESHQNPEVFPQSCLARWVCSKPGPGVVTAKRKQKPHYWALPSFSLQHLNHINTGELQQVCKFFD